MTDRNAAQILQDAFWLEAEQLMFHHTNPWELDEALCAWGYGMGPCEAQDLIGLEKVLARQPMRPVPILPRMVAEGRMGKGGGVGFYRYPGGGGAVIDPLIEDLILEEAWFGKVQRLELSEDVLVRRMNTVLGAACETLRRGGMASDVIGDLAIKAVHFPTDQSISALIQA